MFLNTKSVRNKEHYLCNRVMQTDVDLVFLCETWLLSEGGGTVQLWHRLVFCLSLFLDNMSGTSFFNIAVKMCEVRFIHDDHTVVFLHVCRLPAQSKEQTNKCKVFGNKYLICKNLTILVTVFFFVCFVLFFVCSGDPDVLANLGTPHLIDVPTHRHSHTLDWLITNRGTDVTACCWHVAVRSFLFVCLFVCFFVLFFLVCFCPVVEKTRQWDKESSVTEY